MKFALEFLATFCAGIFAGAATYVSLVEHPARIECGTLLAITQFGPSYRRGTVMQVVLAVASFGAAVGAWLVTSILTWLLGGILILAVIPFTLVAIFPTNKKLLDPSLDRNSEAARELLNRWGRLHWVRTVTSLAAFLVFVWLIMPGPRSVASGRPSGDSIAGARESVLRNDLFEMRKLISQYTLDKQKAPQSLEDLVSAGYIKAIPKDPITNEANWKPHQEDILLSVDQQDPDIDDVHSASNAISSDGTAYSTW